jgi:hypothetical protein
LILVREEDVMQEWYSAEATTMLTIAMENELEIDVVHMTRLATSVDLKLVGVGFTSYPTF